jgi:putative copper resistance protein D
LPTALWTSLWSKVLAAKLLLFAAMLGLAALNRWRLTPALAANAAGSGKQLRRSLCAETGLALGVLALVAVLGLLDPAG